MLLPFSRTFKFVFILIALLACFTTSHMSVQAQDLDYLTSYTTCDFDNREANAGLQIGAVILDFNTGLGCVENLDRTFNTASVPKIFIAAAYYDGVANGDFTATGTLTFTRQYWMGGNNDCFREDDIGTNYTYTEVVEFMINCSDNAATWMLMDALGWQRVNSYVQSLGIAGIGEVIPYAEVDRLKLEFLDERWADVPAGIASRYYRSGRTAGLEAYFDSIPERPNRAEFLNINQRYFDEYSYNTLTPRALAQFVVRMREYKQSGTAQQWFVATNVFNVMLYTQRQYSAQAMPGTVYIGSKNGFDRGLLAEMNVLFDDLTERVPSAVVIMFGQYESLSGGVNNAQLPNGFNDALNNVFFEMSPAIRDVLYPNFQQPQVRNNFLLSTIILNDQSSIQSCWSPYFASNFDAALVPLLETCFSSIRPRITYAVDDNLALGLVLRNLNFTDTRVTFLFTSPNSEQYSYQIDRQNVSQSAIYWFHPLDMSGQWLVDVYINLEHAHSEAILAQR